VVQPVSVPTLPELSQDSITELVRQRGPISLLEMVADACYLLADEKRESEPPDRAGAQRWESAADEICHLYQDLELMELE